MILLFFSDLSTRSTWIAQGNNWLLLINKLCFSLVEEKPCSAHEIEVAFRLASLWKLASARNRVEIAYGKATLTPRETLQIGRSTGAVDWLIEAYAYLACAPQPPCNEDGEAVGWDTYVGLLSLREKYSHLRSGRDGGWKSRKSINDLQRDHLPFVEEIKKVFADEFSKGDEVSHS